MSELAQFALLSDFQQDNPNIARSLESLRWMIRHRNQNGLSESGAVVKRQGRWYVHESRFANWMLGDEGQRQHDGTNG